ncbi:hypothetical protein H2204_001659 [Knufia peltigerae]|uniref:VOC domain-containing protein n=1 Tax=Knufia peltigerae TaxID=1002370 RepID=A0AA38YCN4_9EURO|nr:hypothetical protein H2204_001659 [Knufia peltigerae]
MSRTHKNVFNHLAISVPNLDEAVTWYSKIFGLQKLCPDALLEPELISKLPVSKIYGPRLRRMKIAFLDFGDGVGLELFEFLDPPYRKPEDPFDYAKGGFFHVGITVTDPEDTARAVCENGGRRMGEAIVMGSEKAVYCQDPWGNALECLSSGFEQILLAGRGGEAFNLPNGQ